MINSVIAERDWPRACRQKSPFDELVENCWSFACAGLGRHSAERLGGSPVVVAYQASYARGTLAHTELYVSRNHLPLPQRSRFSLSDPATANAARHGAARNRL